MEVKSKEKLMDQGAGRYGRIFFKEFVSSNAAI